MNKTGNEDLKKQLSSVMSAYDKLDELYSAAQNRENKLLSQLQNLILENEQLKNRLDTFENAHNVRGAGRKKNDAKWMESYIAFCRLYQMAYTMDEVMDSMQISRATYYRYRKIYLEKGIMY